MFYVYIVSVGTNVMYTTFFSVQLLSFVRLSRVWGLIFIDLFSYAQQGCIYLVKHTTKH